MKKRFGCLSAEIQTGKPWVRASSHGMGRVPIIFGALFTLGLSLLCATTVHAQFTADSQTITISAVVSNWVGNGTYVVGSNFVNDVLIIQNGGVLSNGTGYIGFDPLSGNNSALVTGSGSTWKNTGDLIIGPNGSLGNSLTLANGGAVTVTGTLQVATGTLTINGGQATVGQLVYNNGGVCGVTFNSGTLNAGGITEITGDLTVVGDGVNAATLRLQGGLHTFADGLCISSNAVLTGSGTFSGIISNVNPATSGGQIIANGATLTLLGPTGIAAAPLTNPSISSIIITNGGAIVFSGTGTEQWTLTTTVLIGGGATGGSIINSNSGIARTLVLRHPSMRVNNGTLMVVGGPSMNYTMIGGVLTNTYVMTGEGTFTGNFVTNGIGINFPVVNQGTISTLVGKKLVFDPRDAANSGGSRNDTNGTIVIANSGTLVIRRTTNAWYNVSNRNPTNNGTILMQGGTFRGETDLTNILAATVAKLYVNSSSNGVIHGCGTIENFNSFQNDGTILVDCGTFTLNLPSVTPPYTNAPTAGVFTNNGTWKATGGSVLESTALVVNNGTIDITGGTTNFLAGFVNNGTIINGGGPPSTPVITSIQKSGSDILVTFKTDTSCGTYLVETNGNLVTGGWATFTNNITGVVGTITITNSGAVSAPDRFYRVHHICP